MHLPSSKKFVWKEKIRENIQANICFSSKKKSSLIFFFFDSVLTPSGFLIILMWESFPLVKCNVLWRWILADYLHIRSLSLAGSEHHKSCMLNRAFTRITSSQKCLRVLGFFVWFLYFLPKSRISGAAFLYILPEQSGDSLGSPSTLICTCLRPSRGNYTDGSS